MPIAKSERRKRKLRETTACYRAIISSESALPATEPQCARIGHNGGPLLNEIEPLAVSPRVAWHLLGCGNTYGYALIADDELESYLDGRARKITMRSIKAYIARRLAANRATTEAPLPRRKRGRPRKIPATKQPSCPR
jgi:hypothetical protein